MTFYALLCKKQHLYDLSMSAGPLLPTAPLRSTRCFSGEKLLPKFSFPFLPRVLLPFSSSPRGPSTSRPSLSFLLHSPSLPSHLHWPLPPALVPTAKSLQSCPTLCDPIDGSPPGSAIPGILQAKTLEWVAISFSNAWKWKVKVKSLSHVRLFATPWTAAHQAPPSMGFSRQEYWSWVPLPSPSCTKHSTKTVINYPIDDQGCPNCRIQRALLRPCGFQLGCWIWISWPSFIQPISSSTPVLGPANTKKHHFFFWDSGSSKPSCILSWVSSHLFNHSHSWHFSTLRWNVSVRVLLSTSVFSLLTFVKSCFSRVQLFVTPWTVAWPLSMGSSRQEYWSG